MKINRILDPKTRAAGVVPGRLLLVILAATSLSAASRHSGSTCMTSCGCCSPVPSGIVDWWAGDFNANDLIGNYNGTKSSAVTFTPGEFGNAFTFNGSGGINFGSAGDFGTGDFTIAFWIKTSAPGEQAVMEKRRICGPGTFWSIRVASTGGLYVEIDDGTQYVSFVGATNIANDNYHHAALVRQGTTLTLQVDGNVDGSSSSTAVVNVSSRAKFTAGSSICDGADATVPFNGQLDEIEVFNVALSLNALAAVDAGSLQMTAGERLQRATIRNLLRLFGGQILKPMELDRDC